MRVRVVVELDIEPDERSPDNPAGFSKEVLREAALEAVADALGKAEGGGFHHTLEDETSVVVAAVHLLPD
jgi:hypothetical protein